jgi:hypothetical protein
VGKATFGDDFTTTTVPAGTKTQVSTIKGVTASQKADDLNITATTDPKTTVGSQKFSVDSVSIAANTSNKPKAVQVSAKDVQNSNFATTTGQNRALSLSAHSRWRSLYKSRVNHEFIKSKPLGTRAARVLSRTYAKTRQAPRQLPPRTTSHLLVRIESRANRK